MHPVQCTDFSTSADVVVRPDAGFNGQDKNHREASDVLERLRTYAWPSGQDPAGPHTHQHFARLYYQTTRHWIAYLEEREDPELGFLAIRHFYDLYRRNVCDVVDGSEWRTDRHWRPYFGVARHAGQSPNARQIWQLLLTGAYAHTAYDLVEAICRSHAQYLSRYAREPDRAVFRHLMLADHSDHIFFKAAVDYLAAEKRVGGVTANFATQNGARLFRTPWLTMFQSLRRSAWKRASRIMDGDDPRSRASLG